MMTTFASRIFGFIYTFYIFYVIEYVYKIETPPQFINPWWRIYLITKNARRAAMSLFFTINVNDGYPVGYTPVGYTTHLSTALATWISRRTQKSLMTAKIFEKTQIVPPSSHAVNAVQSALFFKANAIRIKKHTNEKKTHAFSSMMASLKMMKAMVVIFWLSCCRSVSSVRTIMLWCSPLDYFFSLSLELVLDCYYRNAEWIFAIQTKLIHHMLLFHSIYWHSSYSIVVIRISADLLLTSTASN
jgi:hypothetical protein